MKLLELLYSFAKVGVFGFGGGPAMIPLIQVEVVDVRGWLSREEFLDAFAFGNALPGPIATKLAGYVGYQIAGVAGAAMGLIGITVPTIIAMIALASFYARYREHAAMKRFLKGVRPVVIALLLLVVWDFAPTALGTLPNWRANWELWLLAAVAFFLTIRFDVHPALLIVAGGLVGIFLFSF